MRRPSGAAGIRTCEQDSEVDALITQPPRLTPKFTHLKVATQKPARTRLLMQHILLFTFYM